MSEGIHLEGERRRCVAMPLGGIGCGQLSIAGTGALRQWEITNQANHLGFLPQSFFALRLSALEPPRSFRRVLQRPPFPPAPEPAPLVNDDVDPAAVYARPFSWPLVADTRFEAAYPFARVDYEDEWPVQVRLEAFTPFVPLDADASGLPLASFSFTVVNRFDVAVTGWLFGALQNVVGWDGITPIRDAGSAPLGGNRNTVVPWAETSAILMTNETLAVEHPAAGSMAIWVDRPSVALAQFDDSDAALAFVDSLKLLAPTVFDDWSPEAVARSVAALQPAVSSPERASAPGLTWAGGLAAPFHLDPGTSVTIEFVFAWHFPNRFVGSDQFGHERDLPAGPSRLGNHYTERFRDALEVVTHYAAERDQLRSATLAWHDALYGSSLPAVARDVLGAQPALIRSPTIFRTGEGTLIGYEGTLGESTLNWNGNVGGSCPANCTHVWNYEQAVARLFPELEQTMRAVDWTVLQAPEGYLPHRVLLPLDAPQHHGRAIGGPDRPALDGMLGTVLKTYREALQGAGRDWLAGFLPNMRRLLDYVRTTWDPQGTGLLTGDQPVTHDISLTAPNMFVGGLWLAALRTMERVLSVFGHDGEATGYAELFARSSAAYDDALWNGEYYSQASGGSAFDYGDGCLADQLVGQWWAHQLDLGYLLPADHVRSALSAVVAHNLRQGFRDFEHGYRVFADADDCGLLNCTWPRGGRPDVPIRYADEVWTGVEYQVAAHCFFEGLDDQGLALLAAVRERYDGRRRNPYNEIECGDHYARAMSGWSILEAITGAQSDALRGRLRLGTRVDAYPLLAGTGWGSVEVAPASIALRCLGGEIRVRELSVGGAEPGSHSPIASIRVDGDRRALAALPAESGARLEHELVLARGDAFVVELA